MKQMEKVGLLLSQGYTKKEIACKLHKSPHTVNQQARVLYEKTKSRNLADITRYTISNILHVDVDSILSETITRAIILVLLVLIIEIIFPEFDEKLWSYISSAFTSLK